MTLPELLTVAEKEGQPIHASCVLPLKIDGNQYVLSQNCDNAALLLRGGSDDGRFIYERAILEIRQTPEGWIYPKRARLRKIYDNTSLMQTWIVVEDFLVGAPALEKYPLFPPLGWRP
jgi:hypothetical protein